MRDALATAIAAHGMPTGLGGSHAHLFASLPIYVSEAHVEAIGRVAVAIEAAVAQPLYLAAALAWAPDIAQFDPGFHS